MFIFCPTWFQTAKGIIENFLSVVQTYGLVPNGGRIYYLKRSQPPFLTLMLKVSVRIPNLTAGTALSLALLQEHVIQADALSKSSVSGKVWTLIQTPCW